MYVVRDSNDMCHLLWHPRKNEERNILNIRVTDGIFQIVYRNKVQIFESLDSLGSDRISKHMLGDNPFDIKYRIWSCQGT